MKDIKQIKKMILKDLENAEFYPESGVSTLLTDDVIEIINKRLKNE